MSDATSYNVKRSTTNGGSYATIAGGVLTTSYADNAVTNGGTYYYVVTAANWNGESVNSGEVAAAVPLPNLGASYSGGNLTLSWPVTATSFHLYNATNLEPPALWSPVTNLALGDGSNWSVSVPNSGGNRFFRLQGP